MRVELRDGQWAELRERITHGADKDLKREYRRGRDDPLLSFDFDTAVIRAFVTSWSVRSVEGEVITLGDADAVERLPSDIADALALAAIEAWTGATIPNPPTPPSSDD